MKSICGNTVWHLIHKGDIEERQRHTLQSEATSSKWKRCESTWNWASSDDWSARASWQDKCPPQNHAHPDVIDEEDKWIHENALTTALTNEEFESFGKNIMARSNHDVTFKLDNSEFIVWPRWVRSIPPQTKVATVNNYREWQVRDRVNGPVWHEFQIDKDEKLFVTPYGLQLQDDEDI